MRQRLIPGFGPAKAPKASPKKPAKKRKPIPALDIAACLTIADEALSKPPCEPWIERPQPRGELVARFVVPLALCPTTNSTRHMKPWMLAKLKKDLFTRMLSQHARRPAPLPGRPHVRCIRFSSREPDNYSDGFKQAIDKLIAPSKRARDRLGFIAEDSPKHAHISQHWERAPVRKGFGLIEILTGVPC